MEQGGEQLNPEQEIIKQLGLRMYESYRHHDHPYTHFASVEITFEGVVWAVQYWPEKDEHSDRLEIVRDACRTSDTPAVFRVNHDGSITKNEITFTAHEHTTTYDPLRYEHVTDLEEAQMLRNLVGWAHALRRVDL